MIRFLISLFFILLIQQTSFAQLSFTTSTNPSNCSASGSISVNVNGGTAPYYYQIISSSSGVVRPVQNVSTFNNLPGGTYTIRVSDANNLTATGTAFVAGNYVPLSFTHTQLQSSILIQAQNGKPPYHYTYSLDGGIIFLPLRDSNRFNCMQPGSYLFRIYDSCNNFYTENVAVQEVSIDAGFSCVPDLSNNTKSITLDYIRNGNGGYSYHAFGEHYDTINSSGQFRFINRCNKNISVQVTDRCGVLSAPYLVCPSPDYEFDISCVNFKDHVVSISNVHSGNGLPYLYIANDILSAGTTISNFPVNDSVILAGLMDSCGFKNIVSISPMHSVQGDSGACRSGSRILSSYYRINNTLRSFPPTRYTSISGPSSFDVTDSTITDSSVVTVNGLKDGWYRYKITNACGDALTDSFNFKKACLRELVAAKYQTCHSLLFNLYKDCALDTTVQYTLRSSTGTIFGTNSRGYFTGMSADSCYYIQAHDMVCDTTVFDTITPISPRIKLLQNSCGELVMGVIAAARKNCGFSKISSLYQVTDFVLTDTFFHTLLITSDRFLDSVPAGTKWIYARSPDCNSDTAKYDKRSGSTDTVQLCLTPTVRQVDLHHCVFAWNIKISNNTQNINYQLSGNGIRQQSNSNFYSVDTGHYTLKGGCNEQELFLPNYYNFKTTINPGCPSNASLSASYKVDTAYINSMGREYFFQLCNIPPMDYNIREAGSSDAPVYSFDGNFNGLKTGTFYNIIFKGNEDCNFHADTIFTPFYKRPSVTATYGLICNGNNATVKVSVVGGTPPYTYQVLNSALPDSITNATSLIYSGLPLGSASFRVYDHCGISTDYSTEVLSVNFQPAFRKKCNGQVQLIAPDIFNTTYVWTNKKGDTIGTTPIVYTYPNGDDTFTVSIKHLSCNISKSLYVSDFSASVVTANAGADYASDTSFTQLHGNQPPAGAVGTWRQIDPSSGNTLFSDPHDANTQASVDVFPGQYTYVWSVSDTAIGCVAEDTIEVSFLRCPGIRPVQYIKNVVNPLCADNGRIDIHITQSATRVHLLWNTGDTSSSLVNLKDSVYIVTIRDESSCTDDIPDTTVLSGTKASAAVLNTDLCLGDTLRINNKSYTNGGDYSDTLVNRSGCDSLLSIHIRALAPSAASDTITSCAGETVQLPSGQNITQNGDYTMKLPNSIGCDSTIYFHVSFHPVSGLHTDTSICYGTTYLLPGGTLVAQSGQYADTLKNSYGCDSIIHTFLLVKDSLNAPMLGNDTTICEQDELHIFLHYPAYVSYIWQDNSTQADHIISGEGIYYVRVTDGCSSSSDTLQIKTRDCSCNFYVPNAFTPNKDGLNDRFQPISRCAFFHDYQFAVYNRLNELLFNTTDPLQGWDGYYRGALQFTESYLWTLEYFDVLANEKKFFKGSVVLLK